MTYGSFQIYQWKHSHHSRHSLVKIIGFNSLSALCIEYPYLTEIIILSKALCFSLSFLHTQSNLVFTSLSRWHCLYSRGRNIYLFIVYHFCSIWFFLTSICSTLLTHFKLACPQNRHGLEPCFSAWLFASFKIMHICDVVSLKLNQLYLWLF